MKRPVSIRDVLSGGLSFPGLKSMLKEAHIKRVWQGVVGKELARRCEPSFLKDGVLHVRVHSPVWATELRFHTELIRRRLNQRLGENAIERVVFRVGTLRTMADSRRPPEVEKRGLGDEDSRFIEETIASIKDPLLKDAVRRAMQRAFSTGELKK